MTIGHVKVIGGGPPQARCAGARADDGLRVTQVSESSPDGLTTVREVLSSDQPPVEARS